MIQIHETIVASTSIVLLVLIQNESYNNKQLCNKWLV